VDDGTRKYVPVKRRTREARETIFRAGTADEISEALWSATYHDPDWRWVQTECLRFLTHADVWVRRNAATCLGLLAVFHQRLDVELVLAALHRAAADNEVKPWAEDSIADIRHTMKLSDTD